MKHQRSFLLTFTLKAGFSSCISNVSLYLTAKDSLVEGEEKQSFK